MHAAAEACSNEIIAKHLDNNNNKCANQETKKAPEVPKASITPHRRARSNLVADYPCW